MMNMTNQKMEVVVAHLQSAAVAGPTPIVVPALACNTSQWKTVNGRLDELCGHNRYPIELVEACDQCWKDVAGSPTSI